MLKKLNDAKYLGIITDDTFNWDSQVDQLNSDIYVLRRIQNTATLGAVKTPYFILFESHLGYGLLL